MSAVDFAKELRDLQQKAEKVARLEAIQERISNEIRVFSERSHELHKDLVAFAKSINPYGVVDDRQRRASEQIWGRPLNEFLDICMSRLLSGEHVTIDWVRTQCPNVELSDWANLRDKLLSQPNVKTARDQQDGRKSFIYI